MASESKVGGTCLLCSRVWDIKDEAGTQRSIEVTVGKSDTDTEYSSAVAIQKMMKSIILVSLAVLALVNIIRFLD